MPEQKRIAVVGATSPLKPYTSQMGFDVGYKLRASLEPTNNLIFTGGVDGVGVDVYTGIIQYCVETAITTGKSQDDKFFVLIPLTIGFHNDMIDDLPSKTFFYQPPRPYLLLARFAEKQKLSVRIGGVSMAQRRKNLANLADCLIVLNGSEGTLDETLMALRLGKPVITLPHTGGSATILSDFSEGGSLPYNLNEEFDPLHRNNIYRAENADQIPEILRSVLKQ